MSLMLVCVLLAAGMLALEREEHAFARLVRGLVSRTGLLVEKVVLAAGCAAAVTLVMVAGVSLFVSLDWSRSPLWVVALGAGGLAFGAMGVAIGALAREVRAASLLAILLALPIAFLALVPSGAVAHGLFDAIRVVSALFPFRASLDATRRRAQRCRRPRRRAGAPGRARRRLVAARAGRAAAVLERQRRHARLLRSRRARPRPSADPPGRRADRDPPAGDRRRRRVRRRRRGQPRAHRAVGADPRRGPLHARRAGRDAAPRRRGLGARDRLRVRGAGPRGRRRDHRAHRAGQRGARRVAQRDARLLGGGRVGRARPRHGGGAADLRVRLRATPACTACSPR